VKIAQVTTPLGLTAWLVEDRSTPVVSLAFSFNGGSARDSEARKGLTGLTATLLTDGAGSLDAQAFKRRLEETAVSLRFAAALDTVGGAMRTLSAKRDEAFDLLRLAMTAPRFDADRFEQRRSQTIAALNQAEQRPPAVAQRTLMATVFAGHPYAITASGVREAVRGLTVEQVKARAQALLTRGGLVLTAVGDIDAAELARELDRTFGELPAGAALASLPEWSPPTTARTVAIERPVPQSSMLVALPGLLREDLDWHAALVMVHVLGGGQQSRLFNEVREKRGLAYSISAGLREQQKAGLLVVSTGSANEHVARSLEIIRTELARMRDGVSDQELVDARTYLSGSLALSLDSSSAIVNLVHQMQIDRLPRDYLDRRAAVIGAVTAEDVQRVARRLLRAEAMTTVVVGKPVSFPEADVVK
jgi:zinc protease